MKDNDLHFPGLKSSHPDDDKSPFSEGSTKRDAGRVDSLEKATKGVGRAGVER